MAPRLAKQLLLAASLLCVSTTTNAWILAPYTTKQRRRSLRAYLDEDSAPVNGQRKSPQQQQEDFTGAGTLGDIMSRVTINEAISGGLVTTDGGVLQETFGISSSLDRMALTANGNLQRLLSSYYDAPVHVVVETCLQTSPNTWNRVVHLTVFDEKLCTATSHITVHDETCLQLVESQTVGLGQLFRHLDILPSFTLIDAGYRENKAMWRRYELSCDQLSCHIHESFAPNIWNIKLRVRLPLDEPPDLRPNQ